MDTQTLPGMENTTAENPSETGFVSMFSGGSPKGLRRRRRQTKSLPTVYERYEDCDPIYLAKAIVMCIKKRIDEGRDYGSDQEANNAKRRALMVNEVLSMWHHLTDTDPETYLCPFNGDYIIHRWTSFRKESDNTKAAWFSNLCKE